MNLRQILCSEVAHWEPAGRILRADGREERGRLVTEQRHGRYYAQELVLDPNADGLWQIQEALDAGDRREWHLIGVSDVLPDRGVILFWDTERPSFGISQPRA